MHGIIFLLEQVAQQTETNGTIIYYAVSACARYNIFSVTNWHKYIFTGTQRHTLPRQIYSRCLSGASEGHFCPFLSTPRLILPGSCSRIQAEDPGSCRSPGSASGSRRRILLQLLPVPGKGSPRQRITLLLCKASFLACVPPPPANIVPVPLRSL